jgi:hypothetical protein
MAQIFESPDKGTTEYARECGQPFNTRVCIKSPAVAEEPLYEQLARREADRSNSRKGLVR